MTIYKTDKKAQQTKVVYSEKGTATVPLEVIECSFVLTVLSEVVHEWYVYLYCIENFH